MVGERQNLAGEVMTVLPFYPDTTFHNYFNFSSVYCLNKGFQQADTTKVSISHGRMGWEEM